jgi:hypothetical protein
MGKIYAGQDVKVRLTISQDITGASVKKIKYIAPDKTTGDKDLGECNSPTRPRFHNA